MRQVCLYLLGFAMLLTVVLLWVASSELVQEIFHGQKFNFDRPLFLSIFNSACASLLLLPSAITKLWRRLTHLPRVCSPAPEPAQRTELRSIARLAVACGSIWFMGAWSFNSSLRKTTVATNTVLSSSSSVFTFFLSLLILGDPFRWPSFFAVLLSFAGCTLVVVENPRVSESTIVQDTLVGDVLTLTASFAFALVSVLLKKFAPSDLDVGIFFGISGLFVLALSPILLTGANIAHVEHFDVPATETWAALTLNALLGSTLANYLWGCAMLLLSPLVASVCLSLSIPISAVTDEVLLRRQSFGAGWILGASLVVSAVVLTAMDLDQPKAVEERTELTDLDLGLGHGERAPDAVVVPNPMEVGKQKLVATVIGKPNGKRGKPYVVVDGDEEGTEEFADLAGSTV